VPASKAPAVAVISGEPDRVGDEKGLDISIPPPWKGNAIVQATALLDHPTLGGSGSYLGMSGQHEAITSALPQQTFAS